MTASRPRWESGPVDPRPFAGLECGFVVLPTPTGPDRESIAAFVVLLQREMAELETELGCPLSSASPPIGGTFPALCLIGPAPLNSCLQDARRTLGILDPEQAHVWIDRDRRMVVIDGPDIEAINTAFQLLRTAVRSGETLSTVTVPSTTAQVVSTIATEVKTTYPAFTMRSLDWDSILGRHRDRIMTSGASLPALQRLFSELEDAHTWVRSARINGRWPYRLWVDHASAMLTDVPVWSAGWDAGARPGDHLIGVDTKDWWSRTSATPRTRPSVTGYRIMSGQVGTERTFQVRQAIGNVVAWTETCPSLPWREPVSWNTRPSGTAYLTIRGWLASREWNDAIETALSELAACPRLLVDLRGNVGGSLIAAQAFRDRFLTARTVLGTIRFSRGDGTLDEPRPILGEPIASGDR